MIGNPKLPKYIIVSMTVLQRTWTEMATPKHITFFGLLRG